MAKKCLGLIVLISLVANLFAAESPMGDGQLTWDGEYRSHSEIKVRLLIEKISTVNLINALYLSKAQVEDIIQLGESFNRSRLNLKSSDELMFLLQEAEEAFGDLYLEIQKGEPARFDIPDRAHEIDNELKEFVDSYNTTLNEKYKQADQRLRSILTAEQIQVVQTFSPCLTPPQDLKNPIRAGQVASNNGIIRKLKKFRRIDDHRWEREKEEILSANIQKLYRRYRLTPEEEEKEFIRISNLVERARNLTDTEFELEKEKIAQQIMPEDKLDKLKKEMEFRRKRVRHPQKSKLVKYLLIQNTPEILRERLNNNIYLAGTSQ